MATVTRRERVLPRFIEEEMRESFLDYSMSVIVQRALPDVRDGLKPVHRRILFAMLEAGLGAGRPYRKSATVVGDVLGKYHPHGDMSVYEAMVRMVQTFAMRYPLVDGQGNFGSVDGDNAAAYRYTEARLTRYAMELLSDIDKNTVDFTPNFDGRLEEPVVLPARVPNLLLNGSSGIAVGMATNIPPHNLREIAGAVHHLIAKPKCTAEDLMEYVPGPDFPTGAYIIGTEGIKEAYRTGRGRMIMRAAVQRETLRAGKEQLVVTALPYGVSKSKVIEQIADLARNKKVEDISDLRDESDRDGMRIVIELKRGAKHKPILNVLYKQTHMQATFGAIMLALDKGVPRELNLKEMLERFRDHRIVVIQRRARFELDHAIAEAHIIDGLLIALDNIDAVVKLIRKAMNREDAAEKLRTKFKLSEKQANAILDMRLAKLTSLETKELEDRRKELKKQILELEKLLGNEKLQQKLLLKELDDAVERFGDERRTQIVEQDPGLGAVEELVAQEQVVVTLSHQGYIKRVPMAVYRRRVGAGKAVVSSEKSGDDFLEHVFVASTSDTLVFFTDQGQAHALQVSDIPEGSKTARGRSIAQLFTMERGSRVAALVPVGEFSAARNLMFLTTAGTIKRTSLDQFENVRSSGIAAIKLSDDKLLDVQVSDGNNDVVLVTRLGRAVRFPEADVPTMGRTAQGVKGMGLREKDSVIGMVIVRRDATLCTITENGYAKRTEINEYPVQRRGGLGTITLDVTDKSGPLVGAKEVLSGDELMIISASGAASRLDSDSIPVQGRATQGKKVLNLGVGDRVVEVARVAQDSDSSSSPSVDSEDQLELMKN
ncbi:MAG TPA: DNA gyrase subunit A [Longimicrobiales bacterium]|nr:DNA gyrase subunit A [Longimicrobiales bacterium]